MKAKIAVIGLGYVGLPLSMALVKAGYQVIGIDYNEAWVQKLNAGQSNIIDVTVQELMQNISDESFHAQTAYCGVSEVQAVIICVPTPLNEAKEPDLTCINDAVSGILPYINKGILISLESTTYPGTTEELIVKRIELEKEWIVGKDFYACYSPERVDPGNKQFSVGTTPKVVGGYTAACSKKAKELYESFLPCVVQVKSTKEAEMSKLLENTFRCVNIALVNEMAMMCERMDIDIWEVIRGASSKPFGFMPFYPGSGVGGHCIPLDPLYLSWEARKYNYFNRFINLASDINSNMPYFVIRQISSVLCLQSKFIKNSKVLLIGMTYKADVGDLRESPSLEVYKLLKRNSALVQFYDPYIKAFNYKDEVVESIDWTEDEIRSFDVVVILVNHSQVDYKELLQYAKIIYDTKNVYENIQTEKVIRLGQNIECEC